MSVELKNAFGQKIEFTSEQKACIDYDGNKTLMIKGYAGSGKSVVMDAIMKKLVETYGLKSKNKIAIFTFQNTLVSSTKELLKVNDCEGAGVIVSTINSYVMDIYHRFVEAGIAARKMMPTSNYQREENIRNAIERYKSIYGNHRLLELDTSFWLEEIDWMKQLNVWTDNDDYYYSLQRKGRGGKVRMSHEDRQVAYNLFRVYCEYLERTNQGDWADYTLFVLRNKNMIPADMKFQYVLIDEAQDLTVAQMMLAMSLCESQMVIAMDVNQKIHTRFWTPKSLGLDTVTKKLTMSMRTTKEIDALAESVRSKNDDILSEDDRSIRAIPERSGVRPIVAHLESHEAEKKYVIEQIKKYLEMDNNITIGIIAAKNNQMTHYSEWLSSENIMCEQITRASTFSMTKPGVKVVSAYGAKGLEFDVVLIPMFMEGYFPYALKFDDDEDKTQFLIKMRNLVYVSMTRARRVLIISYSGNSGSRFIKDMDVNLYDKVDGVRYIKEFNSDNLTKFFEDRGIEVIDKRDNAGCLWIVGDKSLESVIKEAGKKYRAGFTFAANGGRATGNKAAWFTRSKS